MSATEGGRQTYLRNILEHTIIFCLWWSTRFWVLFPTSPCIGIVTASNVSVWLISTQCCNITSSLIPLCHCFSSDSSSCGYHFHHKYHLKLYTKKDKLFIKYPLWKYLFCSKIHFLFARLVLTLSSMLGSPLSFLNTGGSSGRNVRYSIVDTRG